MSRVVALPTITDDSALGGAVIERSLTFNRSDSDHLTYTPASASSDRTKITISAWVKKCSINVEQNIVHAGTTNDNRAMLRFYTSSGYDCLSFAARTSGSWILNLDTSIPFIFQICPNGYLSKSPGCQLNILPEDIVPHSST